MRITIDTPTVIICAYLLIIPLSIAQGMTFYNDEQYQAAQAKEWMWRARATNDLTDMAKYLSTSEELLQDYHGNYNWLYPTPDTDFDLIRQNINETIMNCHKWSAGNITDMAYQQAVHNLQTTISEIADHLDAATGHIGQNPTKNPIGYFLFGMFFWWWIVAIIAWWRDW